MKGQMRTDAGYKARAKRGCGWRRGAGSTPIEPFDADSVGTPFGSEPQGRGQGKLPVVRKRKVRAFTLIELLVVIAIISLLVSILMPTLQQARELALRAKCGVHLHNLGLAINMYADDFNDWLPVSESPLGCMLTRVEDDKPNQTHAWPNRLGLLYSKGVLKAGGDPTVFTDYDSDAGYIDDLNAIYCPARRYDYAPFFDGTLFWWGWCVYSPGEDWRERGYAGYSQCMPASFGNWVRSERREAFEYEDLVHPWHTPEAQGLPYVTWAACARNYDSYPASDLPHRQQGANVLYRDGSVKFLTIDEARGTTMLSDGYGFTWFWIDATRASGY